MKMGGLCRLVPPGLPRLSSVRTVHHSPPFQRWVAQHRPTQRQRTKSLMAAVDFAITLLNQGVSLDKLERWFRDAPDPSELEGENL